MGPSGQDMNEPPSEVHVEFDLPEENTENKEKDGEADFEKAISLCGHGKFHYLLMLVVLPATWSTVFDTNNTSYLLPSAECDLHMTDVDKGLLNAASYVGMVASAYMWGFLADTCGRYRLLVIGYAVDALCNFLASFAQTFWLLLVLKCIGGIIICGPMVIMMSYLSEFFGNHHRARAVMCQGVYAALAQLGMPVIAWYVIPQSWYLSWTMFGMAMEFNSWRVFLVICLIPGLLASLMLFLFFGESPKFLMASGRNEEALAVFRRIYSVNTGLPPDTYPVKVLLSEKKDEGEILTLMGDDRKSLLTLLKMGCQQAKPLFQLPLLPRALLVFSLMFGALMGMNTLRLWMPQLFATMEEYSIYQYDTHNNPEDVSLCDMLSFDKPDLEPETKIFLESGPCSVAMIEDAVYVNSIIVGFVTAIGIICAGTLVNILGSKNILVTGFLIGGISGIGIYWSRSVAAILVLSSLYVAMCGICATAVVSVTVDLFPTSLRTMAISLVMMVGELGAVLGNMLFPVLREISCVMPFFLLGGIVLGCSALSFLVPPKEKKNLIT